VSLTRIKFPVLKCIRIDQYQLFPGKDKKGIAQTFLPGITVIAGINGIGKTTLLNVILRCLTGAYEPYKFDPYNPVGVHKMTSKHVDYFAQRVLDEAKNATVDAEFYFGPDVIRIKRSLNDLEILGLWKNGTKVDGDQGALRKAIYRSSGAGDEYDFFYVVRSFTFFLEDKVSLIWNPQGQFEIFRILFSGPKEARDLAQLADAIKRLDSDYRNRRVQLNRDRKRLEEATQATNDLSKLQKAIREAQLAADDLRGRIDDQQHKLEDALARRTSLTEKTEKIHLEIEEVTRSYQSQVETFFTTAFPLLKATTQLILNNLASGTGCLVCNNPNPKYPQTFLERASKGCCPFCGDDATSRQGLRMDGVRQRALQVAEERLRELQRSRTVLQHELDTVETEVSKLYQERSHLSSDYLQKKNRLESLTAKLPLPDEECDRQLADINRRQEEMDSLREDRDAKTRDYAKMLDVSRRTIEKLKERLTQSFGYYAGEFLAERCTLSWEPTKWRLGEEGELLSFPQFTVEMTSALSQATGSPRTDENQVSESQKEFIDLAFRMALFDAVREDGERAMLVIETPEASLDAVFVDQAGKLLRRFALQDNNARNVVIATINLNRENMLRSLLGLDEPGDAKGKREAPKRVINLLTEAVPNAAMRKYRAKYEQSFNDAMKIEK
jgi:predicted  nucleic acid-binding Zn-ribbon protein